MIVKITGLASQSFNLQRQPGFNVGGKMFVQRAFYRLNAVKCSRSILIIAGYYSASSSHFSYSSSSCFAIVSFSPFSSMSF